MTLKILKCIQLSVPYTSEGQPVVRGRESETREILTRFQAIVRNPICKTLPKSSPIRRVLALLCGRWSYHSWSQKHWYIWCWKWIQTGTIPTFYPSSMTSLLHWFSTALWETSLWNGKSAVSFTFFSPWAMLWWWQDERWQRRWQVRERAQVPFYDTVAGFMPPLAQRDVQPEQLPQPCAGES